jgi:hypothetical protein
MGMFIGITPERKEEVLFLKKKNQKNFDSAPRRVASLAPHG